MSAALHELIDATGGGCCRLRADGTIDSASPGFLALSAAPEDVTGLEPRAVIAELGELEALPAKVEAGSPVFRHVGADGVGRELAAALVRDPEGGSGAVLILVDRSGEAKLRREQARLGRRIEDLEAELAAREHEPQRPRVRSMAELARRLDEALARARRYGHQVTIVSIRIDAEGSLDERASVLGETLAGCVRGVDDLGRADATHWVLLLPHTPLAGGEVVARRIHDRLGELGVTKAGLGVAQVGSEEAGKDAVERADQAGAQALESGGGLLLAVALT
jgi:GGDEF domain-containing protein